MHLTYSCKARFIALVMVTSKMTIFTGNVFSLSTTMGGGVPISHNALQHYPECHGADTGGGVYPYPIMLCNISQNAMGHTPRGVPCQVQWGGYPAGGRGYPVGGYPAGGYPAQGVPGRVPLLPARSGRGGVPS